MCIGTQFFTLGIWTKIQVALQKIKMCYQIRREIVLDTPPSAAVLADTSGASLHNFLQGVLMYLLALVHQG